MPEKSPSKVAVLAARSTIGGAVTDRLSGIGASVALLGRDLTRTRYDGAAFCKECDLTDFDALSDAMGEASEALGGLTGVVNCAGSILLKPAHQCSREDYDDTMEANVATAFATVRAAAKHLASSGGSVVLISSAAATLGMPNHELIGAAKAAVEGLMRSAAATYAPRSIRFNAVAPGLVATSLSEKLRANSASLKISESFHPLGRIGNPHEVASAICWLLDPEQSWVTGQVIGVDGGLSHVQPRPRLASVRP
jgi:NAD(P)-dependent dehydrogenase (short-subunit alcohol dehydrogenase family)